MLPPCLFCIVCRKVPLGTHLYRIFRCPLNGLSPVRRLFSLLTGNTPYCRTADTYSEARLDNWRNSLIDCAFFDFGLPLSFHVDLLKSGIIICVHYLPFFRNSDYLEQVAVQYVSYQKILQFFYCRFRRTVGNISTTLQRTPSLEYLRCWWSRLPKGFLHSSSSFT